MALRSWSINNPEIRNVVFTPLTLVEVAAVERVAVLVMAVIKARVGIMPEEVALVAEHKLLSTALT
jgi:hypothetical protein